MSGNKEITLYYDDDLVRVPPSRMLEELRQHGHFSMALSFVDPATDELIEGSFPFYPKPVVTYAPGGRAFLTRHRDMLIRIPADPDWWCKNQANRGQAEVPQKTTMLKEGEIVDVTFTVEVIGSAIRLPGPQRWREILAKQAA